MTIPSAQIDKIIDQLNELESRVESDTVALEVSTVRRKLKKWDEQGQPGEFAYRRQLEAWEIFFQETEDSPAQTAVEAAPPLEQQPAGGVKSRQDFDLAAARQLAEQGKFKDALNILERLEREAPGSAQVSAWKSEIDNQFNTRSREMEEQAQSFSNQHPLDLAGQRLKWSELLEFNSRSEKARTALDAIDTGVKGDQDSKEIERIQGKAEKALKEKSLFLMNEAVGEIAALLNKKELSEANKLEGNKVQTAIQAMRAKLRNELGESSTLQSQNDFLPAYAKSLDYLRQVPPIDLIIDAAGLMGRGAEAEIKTQEFFNFLRPKVLAGLEKLASDRITSARAVLKDTAADPWAALQTAKATLLSGLDLLNADILTGNDRTYLANIRGQVDVELGKVNKDIEKYNQAEGIIKSAADHERPLAERRQKLIEARALFPGHPALEAGIIEICELLTQQAERDASEALLSSEYSASQENFGEALATLAAAKKAATKTLVGPEFGQSLAAITTRIDQTSMQVRKQQAVYDRMATTVRNCKTALANYDVSKAEDDLSAAVSYMESIAPEFKEHALVREAQRELSRHQADPVKWDKGNESYREARWSEAENHFSQIKSDFAHFAEAQVLVRRAQAAQKYEKGAVAKNEKKWAEARDLFVAALRDLEGDADKGLPGAGTDQQTLPVSERCRQELETLKPIADGEEKIKLILEKLEKDLGAVQKASAARHLPADKVDLQPAFAKIFDELVKTRQEAQSRSDDLTILLSQVRQEWQKTYHHGLSAALASTDTRLMEKGLLQAAELEKNGLLTEEDKCLSYSIQAEMLDSEYRQWFPDGEQTLLVNVDWEKVEKNRRNRLEVEAHLSYLYSKNTPQWEACENRKTALRKEILSISNRRTQREVEQKIENGLLSLDENQQKTAKNRDAAAAKKARQDVYRGAAAYLSLQMRDNPVLRDDLNLMEKWIHLSWQANDWSQALAVAKKFIEYGIYPDGRHLNELFQGLTQAARAFAENNIERGEAYLEQAQKQDKEWISSHQELIAEQNAYLRQELKTRLLQEAEKDFALKTSAGYLSAAQKYALVYQVDSADTIVHQGLEDCGKHIGVGLDSVFARTERMRLGTRSMDEAIQEVELVVLELEGIKSVAGLLGLNREMESRLEETLATASKHKKLWEAVSKQITKCQNELSQAMSNPRPLDEDGSGGWSFESVRETTEAARHEAGKDRDILDFLGGFEKNLNKIEQTADRLNELVKKMMEAVYAEDFDQVIVNAQTLENTWLDVRRKDGRWEGLQNLIRQNYSPPLKEATQPRHHLENAIKQNENLQNWKTWADDTERLHKIVKESSKDLGRSLDELKLDVSLQKVVAECDQTINAVEKLQIRSNDRPLVAPLSDKARVESERVRANTLSTIQTNLAQAKSLKLEAAEEQNKMNTALDRLYKFIKILKDLDARQGSVPRAQVENAKKFLAECEAVDPQNDELREHRKYLQILKFR